MATVTLKQIHLHLLSLPLKRAIQTAHGVMRRRKVLILELVSKDSGSVYSECSALEDPGYHPETLESAQQFLETTLIPSVINQTLSPAVLGKELLQQYPTHPFSISALEMGLWASLAAHQNVSLQSLFTPPSKPVGSGYVLGRQSAEELALDIRAATALGVHKLKFKVSPGTLLETIAFIDKESLFEKFQAIALDGNESFSCAHLPLLNELNKYPFAYIEQPYSRKNDAQLTALKKVISTPIFLDESILNPTDLSDLLAQDTTDGLIIKPAKFGGLQPSIDAIFLCRKVGKPSVLGGMFESGIGRGYSVIIAGLMDGQIPPDLSPSTRYFETDSSRPWDLNATGHFSPPNTDFFKDGSFLQSSHSI